MRYFYTIGKFTQAIQPRIGPIILYKWQEEALRNPIISKYDHNGWDVRSWVLTTDVKEITEEQYNGIVEDDKKIVKEYEEDYGIIISTYHGPFTR